MDTKKKIQWKNLGNKNRLNMGINRKLLTILLAPETGFKPISALNNNQGEIFNSFRFYEDLYSTSNPVELDIVSG